MKVLLKVLALLSVIVMLCNNDAAGQDSTMIYNKVVNFPDKLFKKIDDKSSYINAKLSRQSEKYLKQLSQKEQQLKKLVARKDSLAANRIFNDAQKQYAVLQTRLVDVTSKATTFKSKYLPHLDTLKTAFNFLSKTDGIIKNVPETQAKLQNALSKMDGLQDKFNQAEEIKKFIQERQQLLKEQLGKFGLLKNMKAYQKQVYYYQAQVTEYKKLYNDPSKLEAKALGILKNTQAFKDFFAKNSQLAGMFRLPSSSSSSSVVSLAGLQTRESVRQDMMQRFGSIPDVQQVMHQQVQGAKDQLNILKGKINKLGGGSTDKEMPDFKPNNQKTKSLLQRLEFGSNLQTVKSNKFFPSTTDIELSLGYKLNDKSTIGLGGSYKMGWGKDIRHISISHQGVGVRSFVDYKIKGSFWLSGGVEMNYRSQFSSFEILDDYCAWQKSALFGLFGFSKKYHQALRTELKKIRTGLNGTKVLISTYTYLPLVGITSQADINNRTTYYEYDELSRLKNIKDNEQNIVKRFEYEYASPDAATIVMQMQNFAGNNTIGYPVGVFDVNGTLIGNAASPDNYLTLWNGNSANALIRTLSAMPGNPLKFKLQLNAGKTAPKSVIGCRYYQYDIEYSQIDGIINPNGCYVDFGDGNKMRLGKSKFDVSGIVLPANTTMSLFSHPYFLHTYYVGSSTTLDNGLHTITIYHDDGANESPFMDNRYSPAESLKRLKNLRGNIPQNVENFGGSCFQQATVLSETNITNWSSINSIKSWVINIGDDQTAATNLNYSQDFLKNNKGLNEIQATREDYFKAGYLDAAFKLTNIKSDWNSYFPELASILIREEHWNHENLSALVKLKNFLLVAANTNHSNTQSGNTIIDITPQNIDKVINEIAAGAGTSVINGTITILSGATTRTTSSDAAVTLLKSKGWVIKIKGVIQ